MLIIGMGHSSDPGATQGCPADEPRAEESVQGGVRASTQSDACRELKRGFRSEFKPEKGPREKELFPRELGK